MNDIILLNIHVSKEAGVCPGSFIGSPAVI